jgi:hypothetical protein
MTTTVRVRFDGEVLRPEQPLDLSPDTVYVVTIEPEGPIPAPEQDEAEEHPLLSIKRMAVDMGVDDLLINHDHYAHGRLNG